MLFTNLLMMFISCPFVVNYTPVEIGMSRKKLQESKKKYSPFGERICVLLNTLHINQSDFAKSIGMSQTYISKLMKKTGTGGGKTWRAIMRVYPEWADYLSFQNDQPPSKSYIQHPEHMLPRKEHEAPDSGPGQMSLPEFDRYKVVRIIGPEQAQKRRLHEKLDEILDSGNESLIKATAIVIEELARSAVKDRILEAVGKQTETQPKNPISRPKH